MSQQPRDESRRRVLRGLGALGAGAIGVGAVRALSLDSRDLPAANPPASDRVSVTSASSTPSTVTTMAVTETTVGTQPELATTTVPESTVVAACRQAWNAEPVAGVMVEHVPVRLTLHHTAVSQTASSQGPARARQHQRYHQSLGWPDLAYHFLVDRTGLAYEGRDVRFRGDTGTEYDPTGHFLVCMEGDFDAQEPTAAQIDTTVALFAWASQRYEIDASTLAGHGSYADTGCPGSAVTAMIPELRTEVSRFGRVGLELACGFEGAALVAAVESS